MLGHLPGETIAIERLHELVGIELLYIVYPGPLPGSGEDHHCADHRRHARRIGNRLCSGLLECLFMVSTRCKYIW